jgi:hypothetical protein
LQYVREASPYAGADRPLLDAVMRVAGEESAALAAFGDFLSSIRVPLPYLGSFPVAFTDLNFVAIRSLVPKLVAEQKQDLAKLEADAAALSDPAARTAVERLVEVHRRHLKELEALG